MIRVKEVTFRGHFGVNNLENIAILTLFGYLLEFTSDVLQIWYVYLPKNKDDPREKGLFKVKNLIKITILSWFGYFLREFTSDDFKLGMCVHPNTRMIFVRGVTFRGHLGVIW